MNPEIPFVWLPRHIPRATTAWWKASVPLSPGKELHELEVRNLEFDVQTSTEDFLALLPEFEGHGLNLLQMSKRVPNTLLYRMDEHAMNRILIQNGLFSKFILPHANEVALMCSVSKGYLESLLEIPAARDIVH